MSEKKAAQPKEKKAYQRPELHCHGGVERVTLAVTGSKGDGGGGGMMRS